MNGEYEIHLDVGEVREIDEGEVDEAAERLRADGYVIIKSVIDPTLIRKLKGEILNNFASLQATSLKEVARDNFVAGLNIGWGYSNNKKWKLARYCNFHWEAGTIQQVASLHLTFNALRNKLMGLPESAGVGIDQDGYSCYHCKSIYPANGGFLHPHADVHYSRSMAVVHFKITYSEHGLDFSEGGFFVHHRKTNLKIMIDPLIEPGDLLLFDGSVVHGIDPVRGGSGVGRVASFMVPTYIKRPKTIFRYTTEGGIFESLKAKLINI